MKKITINKINVPTFLYGTAWKEEQTQPLVQQAIKMGFCGIDTANQRRHYYEQAVGKALEVLYKEGEISREDLFLQTKFTYMRGQDHRLPYDPHADYTTQVKQSFASSLEHLKTSYVDSYVLHGPYAGRGLHEADWEVWREMTNIYQMGKTKLLGASNVNYAQLEMLIKDCGVKPHFVQNRCFANTAWDKAIRELCKEHSIKYQGFSLLTANIRECNHPAIHKIVKNYPYDLAQIIFRFALQVGMIPMTGTSSQTHMQQDLKIYDFELSDLEINTIENIAL